MGRQTVENLHRDFSKEREGKRGKEKEQSSEQQGERERAENLHRDQYQKDISEDRWDDREWRL